MNIQKTDEVGKGKTIKNIYTQGKLANSIKKNQKVEERGKNCV